MPVEKRGWTEAGTVAGFAQALPNEQLMRFARGELTRARNGLVVDIGCGAARNLLPLAQQGWRALGLDLSQPMLAAARERLRNEGVADGVWLACAPMEALPVRDGCADLIVAHGIWNLAQSAAEFRAGVREAARVAAPGAALFVFTFSRNTLPASAAPVPGETFVFTQFSGQPQCFLTQDQLVGEMRAAGFEADPAVPIREYNRPSGVLLSLRSGPPVIYEAVFRCEPSRHTADVMPVLPSGGGSSSSDTSL